ncbi:hypothetical protein [Sulfurospirillum arcachonense]|uniref:hypothetical protein n=1 Tax=Sulfurospirillum arcachonense TaxID=57666 RepID=UPI000467F4DE|nr:hypothetical protein [Sulfurospirillum arcachonense]
MIKKIFIFSIFFITILNAATKEDIIELYKNKNYRKACLKAGDLYQKYKSDEEFLNIYAHSCLEEDMINRTILPIVKLYKTKEARENAAYFATILYQKKLLYYALIDDVDISYINLPKTKYILSIIFNKFVSGDYNYKNGAYWFNDDNNNDITYKLSAEEHQQAKKIFLRTYENGEIIKVRTYW